MGNELKLVEEWDKVFPLSDKVNHRKVTFTNHFGITLAADMYEPKEYEGLLPAIAVCGPFGAVKEQSSGLYAQEMAERGFITIAFDPSFTGESGGEPRFMNSPDINVEDFQSAVDFLSNYKKVDSEKISIIGICGWGGMALQTACIDTRKKQPFALQCMICLELQAMAILMQMTMKKQDTNKELQLILREQKTLKQGNTNLEAG